MKKSNSEILFNNNCKNSIVKKSSNDAKRLFSLLEEHASEDKEQYRHILNLYTGKLNANKKSIQNKLEENKLRPFEFLVNNN